MRCLFHVANVHSSRQKLPSIFVTQNNRKPISVEEIQFGLIFIYDDYDITGCVKWVLSPNGNISVTEVVVQ